MSLSSLEPLERLRAHADHPSAFLAWNDDVEHFAASSLPGVIAYRQRRNTIFIFGGPFAPVEHRQTLLTAFVEYAQRLTGRHGRLVAAQVRPGDVALFEALGWSVNQLGTTYGIDLAQFTIQGKLLAKVRQNMARARREGVTVREVASDAHPPQLEEIDRAWLRDKGWHVKRMTFLVGERQGRGAPHRRLFVAERDGTPIGYISYSPAFGSRPGWLYDLTRRTPQASVGTIELINHTALERFTAEGAQWLHLGLTPFARLAQQQPASASPLLTRMTTLLAAHGAALYPARSQEAFKLKWAPQVIEPEFVAFRGGPRPSSLWHLFRITNSI